MIGMLVVETVAKIRRAYFVQGKAICRDLHVSWTVVRSQATEFRYEREEQPLPRLGPWLEDLEQLLSANAAKPSREPLTLIRIFETLRGRYLAAGTAGMARGGGEEHVALPLGFVAL